MGLRHTHGSPNLGQKIRPHKKKKKKKEREFAKFAVPDDHRIKMKEYEKKNKYLDLARELKKYETCRWLLYQL